MYKKLLSLLKARNLLTAGSLLIAGITIFSTAGCSGSTAPSDNNKVLTLSVIREDAFLHEAISRYEQAHPDIKIEIKDSAESYDSENRRHFDSSDEIEKYQQSVNTQVMSGKASDILSVNYLSYKEYADKGLLVNLSDLINSDKSFDYNKYYTSILDSFKYKDSLYGIPIKYYIRLMMANEGMLNSQNIKIDENRWTWDDFVSIGEKVIENYRNNGNNNAYIMTNMDEKMLIDDMVTANFSKFVDSEKKTANFDSKEFINLLNLCKKILDEKLVNTDITGGKAAAVNSRNDTLFTQLYVEDYWALGMEYFDNGTLLINKPSSGDGGDKSFYSNRIFGINKNSKYVNEAWDFIKYLVSDEAQSNDNLFGLPVNKIAANSIIKDMQDQYANKSKENGKPALNLPQETLDSFNKLVSSINSYDDSDMGGKVIQIIQEEAQSFFTGQKTAEETAKLIQDRANTYLNE